MLVVVLTIYGRRRGLLCLSCPSVLLIPCWWLILYGPLLAMAGLSSSIEAQPKDLYYLFDHKTVLRGDFFLLVCAPAFMPSCLWVQASNTHPCLVNRGPCRMNFWQSGLRPCLSLPSQVPKLAPVTPLNPRSRQQQ